MDEVTDTEALRRAQALLDAAEVPTQDRLVWPDNIVGLDGTPVQTEPVDYDRGTIELLEASLALAKRGRASSVIVVLVMPSSNDDPLDYDIDVSWHGRRLSLLAAAARATHRINLSTDETTDVIR